VRRPSVSDEFLALLEHRDDPYRFVEIIARLLGSKGDVVRRWAEGQTTESLQQNILKLTEGGCCDEWEFLYRLNAHTASNDGESVESRPTNPNRAGSAGTGVRKSGNHSEAGQDGRNIIGSKIRALIADLTEAVSSFVITESRAMFVIVGKPRSGKTTILNELNAISFKLQTAVIPYREVIGSSTLVGKPSVVLFDDADVEIGGSTNENQLIKYAKGNNQVMILTCRDTSKLTNLIENCDAKVITVPELDAPELAELISARIVRGYSFRRTAAKRLASLLFALGVDCKIAVALDVVNLVLYPKVLDDFSTGAAVLGDPKQVTIAPGEIERAITKTTGIVVRPPDHATQAFLRREIRKRIRGQDAVIDKILPALTSIAGGMTDPTKPAGVFFLYGPTGVGKTELAKVIADVVYDGQFHKEEMNTFSEKHSVSRLTGAPPGYVGYSDVPAVMDFIDKKKRGVILLDEIEKAHETVADHIMELLDTGFIRDTRGKAHDARGCLIIMTSNITFGDVYRYIGFTYPGEVPQYAKVEEVEELRKSGAMKPEFISRLQVICKFSQLETSHIEGIAKLMLTHLERRMAAVGVVISGLKYVKDVIASYQPQQGARSMRTYVETVIKNKIMDEFREKGGHNGKDGHDAAGLQEPAEDRQGRASGYPDEESPGQDPGTAAGDSGVPE